MQKAIISFALFSLFIMGSISQQAHAREWVRGGAPGVQCLAPGNRENVSYTWGQGNRRYVNVMVGSDWGRNQRGNSYRCMGRCGSNCWSAPSISRAYTKDCLAHDVCSFERNASGGGSDSNCGDEFRAAIGDTVLAISNICRYRRGGHLRAARGVFKQ